jgi:hypothetical protein
VKRDYNAILLLILTIHKNILTRRNRNACGFVENIVMVKNDAEISGEKFFTIFFKVNIFCANPYNRINPQGYSRRFMWINRRILSDIRI